MDDDRLQILLASLDWVWPNLESRLEGLIDAEYFWEPVANCWSLRPRGEARSASPAGKGEWLIDGQVPGPHPAPVTTIAWRMCHLAMSPMMRYDWTFGEHSLTLNDIEWPPDAAAAVEFVRGATLRWRDAVAGLDKSALDTIGFSRFPQGLDPEARFIDLLAWTITEYTHHAAEIACLRDLFRGSGSAQVQRRY
jgi:hypothetical protein